MILRGTIKGPLSRRGGGFCYRVPIMRPLDPWSVDPARLNWMHEYPRSDGPGPDQPVLETLDVCDYEIEIGATQKDGLALAELFLIPNQYTLEKKKHCVWRMRVSNAILFSRRYLAEALEQVFARPQQ